MSMAEYVMGAFEGLSPDLQATRQEAWGFSRDAWVERQALIAAGGGALAMSLPGVHVAAMAGDIALLMNRMSTVGIGIGAIAARDAGNPDMLLEKEDLALILALWAGQNDMEDYEKVVRAKFLAKAAIAVGGAVGVQLVGGALATATGVMLGKKLGPKVAAKVGAKLGAKLVAKAGAGWIPFLGIAVGAGINAWFISEISSSASTYYGWKASLPCP